MNCSRCSGLMHAEEFRDWHSGMGMDQFRALRCLVCGEIVDPVIVQNRRNAVNGKARPIEVARQTLGVAPCGQGAAPFAEAQPVMGRFNG